MKIAKSFILSGIVAMTQTRVIGLKQKLPWHLPADLKHFKTLTLGHPIIMGRKTHESIGSCLPERTNIVISQSKMFIGFPSSIIATSPSQAIELAKANFTDTNKNEIFIIGGARIYEEMLPLMDYLYITLIEKDFHGDTYFPPYEQYGWHVLANQYYRPDETDFGYRFLKLKKAKA